MYNAYLQFIDPSLDSSLRYEISYHPALVALSLLVAIIGSYVLFYLAPGVDGARSTRERGAWIFGGAMALGISIWAMHFIGMLALAVPCGISYDIVITLLSMIPAMIVSGVALWFISRNEASRWHRLEASLLLGGGIGAMHYTGMAAMNIQGYIAFNPGLFWLSLALAVLLSFVALEARAALRADNRWRDLASAVIMGLAVSGMHYTAMAAAYFVKGEPVDQAVMVFTPNTLALMVTAVSGCFSIFSLQAGYVTHHVRTRPRFDRGLLRGQIVPVLLVVALVNLVVIGQTMFELARSQDKYYERAEITTQNLATTLSETLDGVIDKFDNSLNDAKAEIERQLAQGKPDAASLDLYLNRVRQRTPWVLNLRTTDKQGWVTYGTDLPKDKRVFNGDRQYFIVQRDDSSQGLFIGPPILARIEKVWVIIFSRRLNYPDGSFAGVVYAQVSLNSLSKLFSVIDVGRNGVILLRDREMRTVLRYPLPEDPESILGHKKTSKEYQVRMDAGERKGTYHTLQSFDGTPRTVAFHQVGSFPLMVSVELADQDFLVDWQREAMQISGMALVVIVVLTSGSVLLLRGWRRQLVMTENLLVSEEKFRTVADHSFEWEYWESPGQQILFMSPACERITGHTVDEFINSPALINQIIHPDDSHIFQAHRHSAAQALLSDVTFRIVRPDGEVRWITHGCKAVYGAAGQYQGRRISNRDVTALKQASDALMTKSEELDNYFNSALDLFCIADDQGRFQKLNPAWQESLGYAAAELEAQPFANWIHPEDVETTRQVIDIMFSTQNPLVGFVNRYRHKDGSYRWFEWRAKVVGKRIFAAARDITERRLAEEQAKHYQAIVQSSDDAILSKTLDGVLTSWNKGAEKLFGYTAEEMVGASISLLIPEERLSEERYIDQQIAQGNRINHFETLRCCRDGRKIDVSVTISPILDHQGQIVGASKIVRDITASKALQAELEQAKKNAEAANQAKSAFLATMSHEIRTPLNAIIGTAYLLGMSQLSEEQKQDVNVIDVSSKSLLALINDVLDFSKIEAGELSIDPQPFSLPDMLHDLATLFSVTAAGKGITLDMADLSPQIPQVLVADSQRLRQILINLLNNAFKFTDQGRVCLEVSPLQYDAEGSNIVLRFSVTDTGVGISPATQAKLFQPFTQAESSTSRRYGGTGLGLSIVKRLVELMGGQVGLDSEIGKGSCFWVELPFVVSQQISLLRLHTHAKGTLRVLVAEDSLADRKLLITMCQSFGWDVDAVDNGQALIEQVLQRMQSSGYDCLLVDWRMPELDGLEAINELRTRLGDIIMPSVIMVTAYDQDALRRAVTQTPPDSILTKPVQPSTLFNHVNQAVVAHGYDLSHVMNNSQLFQHDTQWLKDIRVLVVDDSRLNLQVISKLLAVEGATPLQCQSGSEALAVLDEAADTFDLILMDLQMPDLDGCAATLQIRQRLGKAALPIIALTAGATNTERNRAIAAGMDDFLTKPVDPVELIRVIRHHVEHYRHQVLPLAAHVNPAISASETGQWPRIAGIDAQEASRNLAGDVTFFRELLQTFLDGNADSAVQARQLIEAGHLAQASRLVHKLRGQAANLGASPLKEAAARLEHAIDSGAADVMENLLAFEAVHGELFDTMRDWLQNVDQKAS